MYKVGFFVFFFLATLCGMWDLSSPARESKGSGLDETAWIQVLASQCTKL